MLDFASRPERTCEDVLGVTVDALSWNNAVDRIFQWALRQESRTVCVCDVHSLVLASQDHAHSESMKSADLVVPDGAPIAWMLRRKGHSDQERISGPDLMWRCCRNAAETGTEMFLYGGTENTVYGLEQKLRGEFSGINIVGSLSPPFRKLTAEEDAATLDLINQSGARIVWVGLGCPKQEAWMRAHHGRINAVMVGVGAAFDFHSGTVKRAPVWMQQNGLEWFHRIMQDPRRLAKRYLVANTMFLMAVLQSSLAPKAQTHDG